MLEYKTEQHYDEFLSIHTIQKIVAKKTTSLSLIDFLNEFPFCLWICDENNRMVHANHAFIEEFGGYKKQKCYQCLMGRKSTCNCCLSKNALNTMQAKHCKSCLRVNCGYDIDVFHIPIIKDSGEKFIVKSSLHFNDPDVGGCH